MDAMERPDAQLDHSVEEIEGEISMTSVNCPGLLQMKDHRKYVNMHLIDCRTGEESSGSSGLERGRRDKVGGSIGSEDGLV
jgi:hypothetical protein